MNLVERRSQIAVSLLTVAGNARPPNTSNEDRAQQTQELTPLHGSGMVPAL